MEIRVSHRDGTASLKLINKLFPHLLIAYNFAINWQLRSRLWPTTVNYKLIRVRFAKLYKFRSHVKKIRNYKRMEFAVSKHRWSLRLLGIWPDRDSLSDLRFVISIAVITSVIIPQLIDLFQNDPLGESVIDNLSSLIPCILVTFKLLMVRVNMQRLQDCFNGMAEDWTQEWQPEFRDEFHAIMIRNAKIGRIFYVACSILLYVTALGFLSLPYTVPGPGIEVVQTDNFTRSNSIHTKLPLRSVYLFNPYRSPIFELTYMSQCLGIVIGATSNFSIDSFLALLVLHFCGQLEILGKRLEHYRGVTKHDEATQIYSGCCSCITCIVERHLRIVKFSEMLEESFHVMLLVQLFGNSVLFCFLGYQIIMNFADSEAIGIVTFLVFMLTMMFHLFLYCYVGEQIMEKSEAIGDCAYNVAWYDLKTTASKSLIILMARSKTPLRITAGKFFTMSLATYTDILKTSATFLSVLRAVKE